MKYKPLVALLALLALLAAACGAESEAIDSASETTVAEEGESSDEEAMTDDDMPDGEMAEDEMAETKDEEAMTDDSMGEPATAIVSLSPSATESLFAIGAGDQVVAVDSYSYYPAEAPVTDLSGFEPNLEAIAAYNPDLVIVSYDPGELVSGLEALGIKAMVQPAAATMDDVYAQIADLGIATGQIDGAADVNAKIRSDIEAAVAAAPGGSSVRVYHELDDTFYSASSNSFIGQLYSMLGVTNIADEADTDGFGFPQLSPEYLVDVDPELIVFTNQVGYSADDIAARPGWDVLSAVKNGNIVQVDADVASRWGPRVGEFLTAISEALASMQATAS